MQPDPTPCPDLGTHHFHINCQRSGCPGTVKGATDTLALDYEESPLEVPTFNCDTCNAEHSALFAVQLVEDLDEEE